MAGTATAYANKIHLKGMDVKEIVIDWTADTTGTVSQGIGAALYTSGDGGINSTLIGRIMAVNAIPGASGDKATNLHAICNMTLADPYGYDLASSGLLNLSSSAAYRINADPSMIVNNEVTLNIASTRVSGAQGRVFLWLEV